MEVDNRQLSLNVDGYDVVAWVKATAQGALVALRPLCEALGLAWGAQTLKLKENPQFNCFDIETVGHDGRRRTMLALPIEEIGMFLCNINANRVKPATRERLRAFQRHLQVAIDRAIRNDVAPSDIRMLADEIRQLRAQLYAAAKENADLKRENTQLRKEYTSFRRSVEVAPGIRRLENREVHLKLVN